MSLAELIQGRRTIQNFSSNKVADEDVNEALQLSLWAPNHKLTFPWRYFQIDGPARRKLANLAVELKGAKSPLSPIAEKAIHETVTNPSHLIILGLSKSADPRTDREDYATLACSVQIASMVLWEKDIGVKWSTAAFTQHAKTYEILSLSPDQIRLEGALMIGKAAIYPEPRERPPMANILRVID